MIAIVGMGFRFPGGLATPRTMWQALAEGRDLVRDLPPERVDLFPKSDQPFCARGGYLDRVDGFDAAFFRINGLEAGYMDPQQRLLLQVAWEAFEDSAIRPANLAGTSTGVFIGAHAEDYREILTSAAAEINAYWISGLNTSILANRLSHFFDLRGPSMTLNTACSSGLAAVHAAVTAIEAGQCAMALAGGVNLILTPSITISAARAGILSPTGACRTFDREADGFVRGEGAGVLLLKPLAAAQADGDRIYGTIRASVSLHAGRTNSLTAPSIPAQREMLVRAYRLAGVAPEAVSFIETHGTGTLLGDSVEIEALVEAFAELGADPKRTHIGLGSIKTQFGHLESAAGIAGMVKVLLAMAEGSLPANLHFRELNPLLNLKATPFHIVAERESWLAPTPLLAGVSSFGFGGTCNHLVLEAAPDPTPRGRTPPGHNQSGVAPGAHTSRGEPLMTFVFSARNLDGLDRVAEQMIGFLDGMAATPEKIDLADMAYTLLVGRQPMEARLALTASDHRVLIAALRAFLARRGENQTWFMGKTRAPRAAAPNAFGQDAQTLCRQWATGRDIAWTGPPDARRIALPLYPFLEKRYWIAANGVTPSNV